MLSLLTGALALAEKNSERWHEAEVHRLQWEALLAEGPEPAADGTGPVANAEQCFRRAIEIARSQQAKSFELRAGTSLAQRLRKSEESRRSARAPRGGPRLVTEGFDTRDLIEAKALLQEL